MSDVVIGILLIASLAGLIYYAVKGKNLMVGFTIISALWLVMCLIGNAFNANPGMAEAIRQATGTENPTIADTRGVTALDLSGMELTDADLGNLQYFPYLQSLKLNHNALHDIGALAGLTALTELELADNTVADVAPLAGLKRMKKLVLADNVIADASPLAALAQLQSLDIQGNHLTDLDFVGTMPQLTVLDAGRNQINNLLPLAGKALTYLNISNNRITDPAALPDVFRKDAGVR